MADLSILFVPACTKRVAAARLRVYQYLPFLDTRGIRYRVLPIVSDAATRSMLASPTFGRWRKMAYYAQLLIEKAVRLPLLFALAARYDVVFLQRTTLPFGAQRVLRRINPNIVFDFDDAIFMADPGSRELGIVGALKEWLKAHEFEGILRASRLAIASNTYLAKHARRYCADVEILEETVDTARYRVAVREPGDEIVIGWIGSPSTAPYIRELDPVLRRLAATLPTRLKLIGAGPYTCDGVKVDTLPWTFESEVPELQTMDIGVMPMPYDAWTEGKLGSKMLQYMAVGIPAVVSYSGTNAEVIQDGVNGMIVRSEQEWEEKLRRLAGDPALRRRLGAAGRKTIEERFALDARAHHLIAMLESRFGRRAAAKATR